MSACVWDYAGRMEFLRHFWDSAAAIDPAAREVDEGRRFPICRPDALETLFRAGGLRQVASQSIEIAHSVLGLRRLLDPIPGRHRSRTFLRRKSRSWSARGVGRTPGAFAAAAAGRHHLLDRPGLGSAWPAQGIVGVWYVEDKRRDDGRSGSDLALLD